MTNSFFEPVHVPDIDDLEPFEHADVGGTFEAERVPAPDRDLGETQGDEEAHLPELGRAPEGPAGDSMVRPIDESALSARIEQARAEAHRQGVMEGRRAESERVRTALEAVRTIVDELRRADARRDKEAADRVVALAAAVAAHLMDREIRTTPDVISDLARRAITEFPVSDPLTVHLHPSDLTVLSSQVGDGSSRGQLTSGQSVRWVPDPDILRGGCLVEGGDRVVDARLSTILGRLFTVLTNA